MPSRWSVPGHFPINFNAFAGQSYGNLDFDFVAGPRYPLVSIPAVTATLVGCALAWGGLILPVLRPLYDYAWFVGFFAAGGLYLALRRQGAAPDARPRPA